jgi:hypothetical protein
MKQEAIAFGLACSLALRCALAVTPFAGSGVAGSSGDGGILVSDTENHRILYIDPPRLNRSCRR